MISLIRYITSIGMHLALIVAGGVFGIAGAVSLLMALAVQITFIIHPVGSGPSLGELMFDTSNSWDLLFAELTPWLLSLVNLLGGGTATYFGVRGLRRRLRLGLPKESEGGALSGAGQIGQVLFFGLGLGFGLYGLVTGLIDLAEPAKLYVSGQKTTAVIERKWSSSETEDKTDSGFFATYSFKTADGRTIRTTGPIPRAFFNQISQDDRVDLRYAPEDPATHLLPGLHHPLDLLIFLILQLVQIAVGVWGIRRALRTNEEPDEAGTSSSVQRTQRPKPFFADERLPVKL